MRLLVDAQCLATTSALRGIGRYALSLTRALIRAAGEHQVEILLAGGAQTPRMLRARQALETLVPSRAIHVFDTAWPWAAPTDPRRRPAAEAAYAAAVRSIGADAHLVLSAFERDDEHVLHVGHPDLDPPTAVVLYDLIPAQDPAMYLMGPEAPIYWRRYEQLARCHALLPISDYSARQAAGLLGAACPSMTTLGGAAYPSGAFPDFEPRQDDAPVTGLPARFILAVGGDHPRKNLDRLVEAWAGVPANARRGAPLVLACRLSEGTSRRLTRIAARAGLHAEDLILLGRVSEPTLSRLYAEAELFVFPSTVEGLGMPALEAMAAGCPTLLARSSSLVELCDDERAFFDPLDVRDIANAVTRALVDADTRAALRRAAARADTTHTWEKAAARAWVALEALPGLRLPGPPRLNPAVRLSDTAGMASLPLHPAPVLLDIPLPSGPAGVLGLPLQARADLAPAAALLAPSDASASAALRAGLLDQPVLSVDDGPDAIAMVAERDFYGQLGLRLSALDVPGDVARSLVSALQRAPRWTLQRPRPVWLLLGGSAFMASVEASAESAPADLVVGDLRAAHLATQVDVVLIPADQVARRSQVLAAARCRGTRVFALHPPGSTERTPEWCEDVVLVIGATSASAALGSALTASWRSTGWPWLRE